MKKLSLRLRLDKLWQILEITAAIVGIIAVGFGLLMGQLGTIFQAVYSLTGALKGPVDGIFVTGMFAPWANIKVRLLIKFSKWVCCFWYKVCYIQI